MATIVDVIGSQLKLDGSFNPRWGENNFPRLLQVLSNPRIVSIRLSQINFSRLDQAFVTLLGTVMKSRVWDRIYLAYCEGTLPDSCLCGMMMAKQLEIYGSILNLLPALGVALARNTAPIECLRLRTRLDEDSMVPLAEGLKSSKLLMKLYLTCAFADEESAHQLANSLAMNQDLELLSLYSCEFENEASIGHILTALHNHPRVVTLELRDNNVSQAAALSTLVSTTTTIENLDLYLPPQIIQQTQIPRLDSESFFMALRDNQSLKSLALANNALSTPDVLHLSTALRSNKTLQRLNLQGNLVTDEAIQVLASSLPEISLKELCLWNNPFTAVGAQALLEGLRHQCTTLQGITTFSRFPCSADIKYYTHLNRAGRRLLQEDGHFSSNAYDFESDELAGNDSTMCNSDKRKVPLALWSVVLGRVNDQRWSNSETASVLFTLLREGPAVVTSKKQMC